MNRSVLTRKQEVCITNEDVLTRREDMSNQKRSSDCEEEIWRLEEWMF
jgi:hypothetical protein